MNSCTDAKISIKNDRRILIGRRKTTCMNEYLCKAKVALKLNSIHCARPDHVHKFQLHAHVLPKLTLAHTHGSISMVVNVTEIFFIQCVIAWTKYFNKMS